MSEVLRSAGYHKQRVLIETARVLDPQFDDIVLLVTGAQLEMLRNLTAYLHRETTFVSEYSDVRYLTPTAGEWDSLQAIVASLEDGLMVGGGGEAAMDYVCVRDKKAITVDGGDFDAGAWRTRDINDEQADASGICSILNNQITLDAGEYICSVSAPSYKVSKNQLRLYNITDTAVLIVGTSERSSSSVSSVTRAFLVGRFVLDAEKTLEVQHRCTTSFGFTGFGQSADLADEIYTIAEFWRRAT